MKKPGFKLEWIADAILILYALIVVIFSFRNYGFAAYLILVLLLSRIRGVYGLVGSILLISFLILLLLPLPWPLGTTFDDLTLYLLIPIVVVALVYLYLYLNERKKTKVNVDENKSRRWLRFKTILGWITVVGVSYSIFYLSFGFGGEPFGLQMAEMKMSDYVTDKYGDEFSTAWIKWDSLSGWYALELNSTKFESDFDAALELFPYDMETDKCDAIVEASYGYKKVYAYLHMEVEVINNDANIEVKTSRELPYAIANKVIDPLMEEYGKIACYVVYVDRNGRFEIDNTYYDIEDDHYNYTPNYNYDYREVLIDDPFTVIEFVDKGFEEYIRYNLELDDGPIQHKDIALLSDFCIYSSDTYGIKYLEDVKWLTSLEYLLVSDDDVTVDLNYLSELKNLWSIQVWNGTVKGDLASLSNLRKLLDVNIYGSGITGNLSSLSSLTKIFNLSISNAPITGDLSSISRVSQFVHLDLNNTKVSGDISALSVHRQLCSLNLSNTDVGGEICSLQYLTNLRELYVENTNVSNESGLP